MMRPGVLGAGDRIRFAGVVQTVVALSGTAVRLIDEAGVASVVLLSHLLSAEGFALLEHGVDRVPLPPVGRLEGLPAEAVERARWWERHIMEVLTGLPPQPAPGAAPKPAYDPATRSLRQRELAKVAELAREGHPVGLSTVKRLRLRYQTQGLWGLVDGRAARSPGPGRVDARVVEAIGRAVAEQTDRSTGTVGRLRHRVEQLVAAEHGAGVVAMPSQATFYRLVARASQGRHTFGSARTRRSLAKQPPGPFGTVSAVRPGEWMQIDSTPLDVAVVLDDGVSGRVELTGMVDLATRSITAAVLRPTTKAVDAALLLARTLTPEPMRPGWPDALRMARSVLPHRGLLAVDARLEHAAARPVIVPETIVCDHGSVYVSQTFRSACQALGINFQPAHPDTPTDKPVIERTLQSVGTLFCQFVAGYVGSSVERRGKHADQQAAWSLAELQALLDEWVVACWQNRPHEGLRDPLIPGKALTPNERYAAVVAAAGYVAVPLGPQDYLELLPALWRTVNAYGIKVNHRVYDCQELTPLRHQDSGIAAKKGRWEVHYDPYDVCQVWVRDHQRGGWIAVPWTHLRTAPVPFGEHAWNHARKLLAGRGEDARTEQEIAQAVSDLLERAGSGPATTAGASKKDRRVAARTRTTSKPTWPRPQPPAVDPNDRAEEPEPGQAATPAKVVPLGVFDAYQEATKPW